MAGVRIVASIVFALGALAAVAGATAGAPAEVARPATAFGADPSELLDASAQRHARAGRPFSARVEFDRERLRAAVRLRQLSCRVSVRGRVIRKVVRRLRVGAAVCTWQLPRWTRGRRLQGHIGLRTARASVRLAFARRVR